MVLEIMQLLIGLSQENFLEFITYVETSSFAPESKLFLDLALKTAVNHRREQI